MGKITKYLPSAIMGTSIAAPLAYMAYMYQKDDRQKQHAILRNFPLLGRVRYMTEHVGPELRQYLFADDNEGQPFSRLQYQDVVKAGKYNERLLGFGSNRDFEEDGYYIRNTLFPKLSTEMKLDNTEKTNTYTYVVDNEGLFSRKEHHEEAQIDPYFLRDEDAVVLGEGNCRQPFHIKGQVGMSAMSYGALGERAITALSKGLAAAGGTWMNTGEGGISDYHLAGNADLMMQIGPGLFGVRTTAGEFSWEAFKEKSEIEQVKAFEVKLAQGAKTRGGHLEGQKVTEEIARIRLIEPGKTVNSPNRFVDYESFSDLFDFIEQLREVGGKPVGMKIVVGDIEKLEEMVQIMRDSNKGPDFITIDGSEGGTGATYQELADSVGLPIMTALPIVDELLREFDIRDRVKLIASGKLVTPDKAAIALGMGADLINIARGFMISVGCIMAEVCHTNTCPVGVATTDPELQTGLIVDEKRHRVTNYVTSLRAGLFNVAAAAGVDSPTKLERRHLIYKDYRGRISSVGSMLQRIEQAEDKEQDVESLPDK
ncbi:FMN-binding glutamate synthase family protein [Salinicoccus halodurans]|uniref:Glutamate synthase domain-containing protein 2 n=1 Tax=Salinicoccus halodurans TaxID=407035 RepID=A0A0F7HID9_9STAP|nr:FMN-binding glutamate synthase family protein [Salinicoccus halodurans]AKG72812.1 membrane protein [Salinicoccus halodurans]SFK74531.1 Glutamate synthase domain-containing protein 2 [Salinicoccus halodurans]